LSALVCFFDAWSVCHAAMLINHHVTAEM